MGSFSGFTLLVSDDSVMEEKQEEKLLLHVCKLCDKQFMSSRILGGHMKSHFVSNRRNEDPKMTAQSSSSPSVCPKKSLKASSLQVCEVCGKEFRSLKALFGHLRIHSGKDKRAIPCEYCGKVLGSAKSLSNHKRLHRVRVSEELRVCPSPNFAEENSERTEILYLVNGRSETNKYNMTSSSCSSFSSFHGSSSSVAEIEQDELEEAARCLIMLSEGFHYSGAVRNVLLGDDSIDLGIKSPKRSQKRAKTEVQCSVGVDHQFLKLKRPGNVLISQCLDSCHDVITKGTDKACQSDLRDLDDKQEKIKLGFLADNASIYGNELKPKSSELQTHSVFNQPSSYTNSGLNESSDTEHTAIPSSARNKAQKNSQDSSGNECGTSKAVFGSHQALNSDQKVHGSRQGRIGWL